MCFSCWEDSRIVEVEMVCTIRLDRTGDFTKVEHFFANSRVEGCRVQELH